MGPSSKFENESTNGTQFIILLKKNQKFFVSKVPKIGTEYRYRRYLLTNVRSSVPTIRF